MWATLYYYVVCVCVFCVFLVKVAALLGQSSNLLTDNLIQLLRDDSTEVCIAAHPVVFIVQFLCQRPSPISEEAFCFQ